MLLKSHSGKNNLKSEVYANYSTFSFPLCIIDIRLWLTALSGELHDNVNIYIIVKKGEEVIFESKIVSNVDLIGDYDFSIITLNEQSITLFDKISEQEYKYNF